jgi:sugar (pentulose or hexulose) kinase
MEPANFARIRHILLLHESLNFWLTGRLCAEYCDASAIGGGIALSRLASVAGGHNRRRSQCLGAAMQAIFAWSYNEGSPQTFEAIAERCVKVDKERTTRPEIPLAEEYEVDRSRYRSSLASLYAV